MDGSANPYSLFLERYWCDHDAGQVKGLSEYLVLFPGDDARIIQEYVAAESGTRRRRGSTIADLEEAGELGGYRIIRRLGHGGQGIVYLAEEPETGRRVALKVLRELGAEPAAVLARFRREASVASPVDHPGICRVYDAAVENNVPFIAMRYVEGESLAARLAALRSEIDSECLTQDDQQLTNADGWPYMGRPEVDDPSSMDVEAFLGVGEKVARALHALHQAGIVHRDVKPGNILLGTEGEVVITDFGLARAKDGPTLTQLGEVVGTPAYMSPEQVERKGTIPDARTDVWSLGVTLFECLTLRRPFEAPSREELFALIVSGVCPDARRWNPSVSADLQVVLETALEKSPDRRYQTTADFADELRRVRVGQSVRARKSSQLQRFRNWCHQHPSRGLAVTGSFLALVGLLVVMAILLRRGNEALEETRARQEQEHRARRRAEAGAGHTLAARAAELSRRDPDLALSWAIGAHALSPNPLVRHILVPLLQESLGRWQMSAHPGAVSACILSPEGAHLVTVGQGSAFLWDPQNGTRLFLSNASVTCAAFSPQGDRVVVGTSEGNLLAWALPLSGVPSTSSKPPSALAGFPAGVAVSSVTFTPEGKEVLAFGSDGSVHVAPLDPTRAAPLATPFARFTPAGVWGSDSEHRYLVGSFADGATRIFDLGTDAPPTTLEASDCPAHVAVSSASGSVATVGKQGRLRLWGLDGKLRLESPVPMRRCTSVGFDPSGRRLIASSEDRTATIYDVETGEPIATLTGHLSPLRGARFSPSGGHVVVFGDANVATVWSSEGERLGDIPGASHGPLVASFSHGGRCVVVGDGVGNVQCSYLPGRNPRAALRGHEGSVQSASFDAEGKKVVTASIDGTARVWDLSWAAEPRVLAVKHTWMLDAVFHPSEQKILTGSSDGVPRVWDLEDLEHSHRLPPHEGAVEGVSFDRSGEHFVTAGADGRVHIHAWKGLELLRTLDTHRAVKQARFSPDARFLLTCGGTRVEIWSVDSGSLISSLQGLETSVESAEFDPSGDRVVIACWDRTARVFRVDSWEELAVLRGHDSQLSAAAFDTTGTRIVTAGWDHTVRVFGGPSWTEESCFFGHRDWVLTSVFDPAGRCVMSASRDGTVRFWPLDLETCVAERRSRQINASDLATHDVGTEEERAALDELLALRDAPSWERTVRAEIRFSSAFRDLVLAMFPRGGH